jgi:hypothetical protein
MRLKFVYYQASFPSGMRILWKITDITEFVKKCEGSQWSKDIDTLVRAFRQQEKTSVKVIK